MGTCDLSRELKERRDDDFGRTSVAIMNLDKFHDLEKEDDRTSLPRTNSFQVEFYLFI